MTFQPGEVVLIPFPFSDNNASKRRPVLVLTPPDQFEDLVCLAITSSGHHSDGYALDNSSFSDGKLPKPSWVRVGKVYTLSGTIVVGKFGTLVPEEFRAVKQQFCRYIGCSSAFTPYP